MAFVCTYYFLQKHFFISYKKILLHYIHARAPLEIFLDPKNFFPTKYQKNDQNFIKILKKFFFSKFHTLCLLYANHTKFFSEICTTLELSKINFKKICITQKNFILNFRKKKIEKLPIF